MAYVGLSIYIWICILYTPQSCPRWHPIPSPTLMLIVIPIYHNKMFPYRFWWGIQTISTVTMVASICEPCINLHTSMWNIELQLDLFCCICLLKSSTLWPPSRTFLKCGWPQFKPNLGSAHFPNVVMLFGYVALRSTITYPRFLFDPHIWFCHCIPAQHSEI